MDKLRLILRRKKTREHIEKPSKHGKDQLQQLYSREFQVILRINTRLYPSGHPSSYNPVRLGLTWNSVVKRNALTTSAIRDIKNTDLQNAYPGRKKFFHSMFKVFDVQF